MEPQRKPTHKNERLQMRTSGAQLRLLSQAAEVKNESLSAFVLESAVLAAEHVLADRSTFLLEDLQWDAFVAALDAPAVARPELAALLRQPSVLEE